MKHGHSVALENAKLGHPSLHADQEDQVVGICPGDQEVAEVAESYTGQHLKMCLENRLAHEQDYAT